MGDRCSRDNDESFVWSFFSVAESVVGMSSRSEG